MVCVSWTMIAVAVAQIALAGALSGAETLGCHQRRYNYRVTQSDDQGRQCWDELSVMSCWGRCDSNEISDYRFPFKQSHHPVCVHAGRSKVVHTLAHCEAGVAPGTERYEYLAPAACRCQACTSSDTSCEGVRYRGHRAHTLTLALGPDDAGFGNDEENLVD